MAYALFLVFPITSGNSCLILEVLIKKFLSDFLGGVGKPQRQSEGMVFF
ncbi:hypothetical protein FTV88_3168 [Heliorestis convoluta]|uniref:Uncharacterized protein n=1 Tax=Heliorestis convoluta TaxID=356322 RepID=A0A5Q2N765_9FIRM|nr:hypothetical protein FTV88_3168 [Heliorestis convoluta]